MRKIQSRFLASPLRRTFNPLVKSSIGINSKFNAQMRHFFTYKPFHKITTNFVVPNFFVYWVFSFKKHSDMCLFEWFLSKLWTLKKLEGWKVQLYFFCRFYHYFYIHCVQTTVPICTSDEEKVQGCVKKLRFKFFSSSLRDTTYEREWNFYLQSKTQNWRL